MNLQRFVKPLVLGAVAWLMTFGASFFIKMSPSEMLLVWIATRIYLSPSIE